MKRLQLFAENGTAEQGESGAEDAGTSTAETKEENQGNKEGQEPASEPEKKYTDADVDKIVAKKIAAERQRMQKLFIGEQQENEIEKRERDVLKRELMADAKDALINDGFPSSLAMVMNYSSKEDFEQSYREVTDVFREAMQQEYKRRLSGNAPKVGSGNAKDPIAEAFAPKARY